MNAVPLQHPSLGAEPIFWACGLCKQVSTNKASAEHCCVCKRCGLPKDEQVSVGGVAYLHPECRKASAADFLVRAFGQATLREGYDGPVWDPEGRGPADGFYYTLHDLQEWAESSATVLPDFKRPVFAWVSTSENFRGIDLDEVIETVTEECYEDMASQFDGEDDLRTAVAVFNALNRRLLTYREDMTGYVLVPPAEVKP